MQHNTIEKANTIEAEREPESPLLGLVGENNETFGKLNKEAKPDQEKLSQYPGFFDSKSSKAEFSGGRNPKEGKTVGINNSLLGPTRHFHVDTSNLELAKAKDSAQKKQNEINLEAEEILASSNSENSVGIPSGEAEAGSLAGLENKYNEDLAFVNEQNTNLSESTAEVVASLFPLMPSEVVSDTMSQAA